MTACRPHCGACCIAPSITSALPGSPAGKPAGVRCPHLRADLWCGLFGASSRPSVCASLQPSEEMCGSGPREAMRYLRRLERQTALATGARTGAD
jgi:Fe-S-cluster containining protein